MAWEAIVTLLTLFSVLAALVITRVSADLVLMAALAFLLITGILGPADALAGFANPGVITIATLYVVAAGLKETGAVQWIARLLLGHPKTEKGAQLRMLAPTGILSGFMNNTAVVAMFIPAIQDWAQRLGIPSSRLLLPLSYAAILGGTVVVGHYALLSATTRRHRVNSSLSPGTGIHPVLAPPTVRGGSVALACHSYLLVGG